MKFSVIYTTDKVFQVLEIVNGDSNKAWIKLNESQRSHKENGIIKTDVESFRTFQDMNDWITEQVIQSRF